MELITGIHIDVPGNEMKTIFEGRLQYHRNKAATIETQLTQLRKLDRELADEAQAISKGDTSSMSTGLEGALKKHNDLAIYYDFMVKHVVISATYRLSQTELLGLGIQPERFW